MRRKIAARYAISSVSLFLIGYFGQEFWDQGTFARVAYLESVQRISFLLAVVGIHRLEKSTVTRAIAAGLFGFMIADQFTIWIYCGDYGSTLKAICILAAFGLFEFIYLKRKK